jgi:hypothetical protein
VSPGPRAAGAAAGLLALLLAGGARADQPRCADAPAVRAPDLRCGETLDGRPREPPDPETVFARQLLGAPRLLSRAAFWPVIRTGDFIESHDLPGWFHALLTSDDGRVGVRPELQYASSFLATGGAHVFYRRLPGVGGEAGARFVTGGPSAILAETWLHAPSPSGLHAQLRWERRRDWLFAGIGSATNAQLHALGRGEARYGAQGPALGLSWSRTLLGWFTPQLSGDLLVRTYQAGQVRGGPSVAELYGVPPATCALLALGAGCVDPLLVPGFEGGLRLLRVGPRLVVDLLPPGRDAGGAELSLGARYAEGVAGDPSRHLRFDGGLVGAIGGRDRVLLTRLDVASVHAIGSAPIPFEELVSPSGTHGIRGLPDGRLRGSSGVVASAEYRWYIASRLDASLFTDLGTVAGANFSGIGQAHWFPSFGLGVRYFRGAIPYWRGVASRGVELTYAPGSGFRVLFALAGF